MVGRVLPSTRKWWCFSCFAAPITIRGFHGGPSSQISDDLKAILAQHYLPVRQFDIAELPRFQARGFFRDFVLRRFDLGVLEAQGEESTVRRVVHNHLLLEEPQYRQLVGSLATLPDPFGPLEEIPTTTFQPEPYRLTTASQRNSHLAAATTGRAGIAKALGQLGANLGMLREEERKLQDSSSENENENLLRAKIQERQARVEELERKQARFDALIQVLAVIEEKLVATKAQVLERRRQRGGGGGGGGGNMVGKNNNNNNVRANSHAWGKAVEKEGKEVLEVALKQWRQRHPNLFPNDEGLPFVITAVTLQGLDSDEIVKLRHDITQQHAPIYDNTSSPKAELDALVVLPASEDPFRLQVVLAVEMKRSLDEVALDCLKFHLSLELCRRAPPGTIRFSSSSGVKPKFNKGRVEQDSGWSTQGGYVLDFSSLRLPDEEAGDLFLGGGAVYLTKKGGATLRATNKLMLEQVQLTEQKDEDEEANGSSSSSSSSSTQVEQQFYAPDFVRSDDDEATRVAADEAREAAIDVLFHRFTSQGVEKLKQRLDGVIRVLTGQHLEEGGDAPPRLHNVFVLGKKDPPPSPTVD